tara:strand:+ start:178 stop:456 length:279 start_codon:yes stop_codon:yes gene_type:complete
MTADCLFSKRTDAPYVAWAERYTNNSDSPEIRTPKAIEETVTVVTGSGHIINLDEPQSVGGNDGGSTPYYLLFAALGACKSMTMRMFAEYKG